MLWSTVSAALARSPVDSIEIPPPRAAAERDTSFARYAAISQRDLFGSSQPDEASDAIGAVGLDEDLPEAALPYTLVGTVAMSVPELSLATLAHQSRRDERGAYRVGDRLAEGHRIVGIDKRRIVVDKDGVRSQLRMDDDEDVAAGARGAAPQAARKAPVARSNPEERRAAARRRAAERRASQRAEQLRKLREEQEGSDEDEEPSGPPPGSARLESLMNSMRMNPVQGEDGELEGVRIESTDPDGPFAELSEGTVCYEMNGIHLSQMHVAIQSLSDDEPACMKCRLPSGEETITCF